MGQAQQADASRGELLRTPIDLALARHLNRIPIRFEDSGGNRWHLDRGCIKIAERAGLILPFEQGPGGVLDEIELAWRADGSSVLE